MSGVKGRGSGALNRGLAIEQLFDPELSAQVFEEMHVAYMRGLTKCSPPQLRLLGLRPLRALIEHAISASPYYRDVLGRDPLAADMRLEELRCSRRRR